METLSAESVRIAEWLNNIHVPPSRAPYDVRPCIIHIGRMSYPAAHYRQGPGNNRSRFYVVGKLPSSYVNRKANAYVVFSHNGIPGPTELYVASYLQNVPGGWNIARIGDLPEHARPYHYQDAAGNVLPNFLLFEHDKDWTTQGRKMIVSIDWTAPI